MKLIVRTDETMTFYPLATWSWDSKKKQLIQRIPAIREIRFGIPGQTKTPGFQVDLSNIGPSLQTGQMIRLDDKELYVAHIEMVQDIDKERSQAIFIYIMSEIKPELPAFWSIEVQEEK